jgi:hypothetical protein
MMMMQPLVTSYPYLVSSKSINYPKVMKEGKTQTHGQNTKDKNEGSGPPNS